MNKLDERGWKRLISAISNKEVVPIIGKELFKVNGEPLQTYINKQVCKNLFVEYQDGMTVDQIVDVVNAEEGDGKRKFCNELSKIFSKIDIPIPESIKRLIDINRFPMLLTTSYTPILEKYLSKDKMINWKSYAYDTTAKADIPSTALANNVLYYIFGKIGVEGTFVVDEDDLLSFLHFWHDENTRPKELCKYLSNKYLLVIGCDYPDWLFRFLWYSMNNNFNEKSLKKGQLVISNKKVMEDIELQSFLRRIKAYYDNDIDEFIIELCKRCKEIEPSTIQDASSDSHPVQKVDFFISYAHEDYEIADKIASMLRDLGASVWFDKKKLKAGDQFPDEIKENIEECKRFMPILSNNTTQETRRFFRKEWKIAKDEAELRLGIPYITPVSIDNVNIKHHLIPTEFSNVHVLKYQDGIEEELRDLIREIRRN